MKFRYLIIVLALLPMVLAFTFSPPGDDGWSAGELLAAVHLNELDTALNALQDGTGITALSIDTITGDTVNDDALDVVMGGTGRKTSTTAYGLIAAGMTDTGDQQTLAAGATTEILVGGGASALPVWTAATGSGAPVRATSPTLTTPAIGAATATTPAANDDDTSVATTAYVQGEINGAGGTDLTCAAGVCNVDAAVTRNADLSAYTVGTAAPEGACTEGDMYLDHTANVIWFCVDTAGNTWFGVTLLATP